MFRIFTALTLLSLSFLKIHAQDVLIDKKGQELPCQLIGADKKNFSYKGFQDPEFSTQKTPISRYRKIKYADGREVKITPPPSGWISFTLGPAIPFSSYASSSIDNQYAGFAKTGSGFQLEGAFPAFGKRRQWCIVGILGGFNNGVDTQGKLAWYQNSNTQNSSGFNSNGGDKDKQRRWGMTTALLGVGYTIPVGWKFSVDQKLAIGLGIAKKNVEEYGFSVANGSGGSTFYRYFSYGNIKSTSSGSDSLTRAKSATLGFCYGIAVRFNITRSIAFKIGADVVYAAPTFEIRQYMTPDPPSGQAFDPSKTEQVRNTITVVRLNLGLCINLIPKNIDYGISK